jgi:subtilisin family serine protease
MRRIAVAAFVVALAAPAPASAARFAVGVERGADTRVVAKRIEARTGLHVSRFGSIALSLRTPDARPLRTVPGVAWVERMRASRRLSFTPNDPFTVRQWYLNRINAFDAWLQPPILTPVRVAVLDSGIDSSHPELQNRIADGKSFVASSWETDTNGHGTFVAGEIAAALNNAQGIAGVAFPASLLVAKIVRSDGTISPDAEANAIRWAVDNDARVINMSFGGIRVPGDPTSDTFSPLEAAAVRYAVSKGVLVVAAVGNGDNAPTEPWGYAGYPAALPHVLGVSAIGRDGSVPIFSNRDRRYNDIAAPGEAIFSTLPRALTLSTKPGCLPQGYSDCGPPEFRRGEGTSFSAPQVVGAAALLFGVAPWARADQVANALTRSAADADPDTGCVRCTTGRDALTGWGLLDVENAVRTMNDSPPDADRYEVNDDVSLAASLWGRKGQRIHATIDYWDDRVDAYKVKLGPGQRFVARLRGPGGANTNLFLWKPGTTRIGARSADRRLLAGQSKSPGSIERIRLNIREGGWYYLVVRASSPGSGRYSLRYRKRAPQERRAVPR